MTKKTFLPSIIFSILFLTGCTHKIPLSQLNKEKMHELSIVNTRKGEIVSSQETKAIIVATYLNPINVDFINNKEDVFLVGVYISNDTGAKIKSSADPFYKFSLNGDTDITDIQKLNLHSKYLKLVPLINKWAEYYLVKFPAKKSRILTLTFENKDYGKAVLTFEKAI